MKPTFYILLGIALLNSAVYAQQVAVGTDFPNESAILHLEAIDAGVLIPKVSLLHTLDAITITNPAHALLVYNTNSTNSGSNDVEVGFYYNSGTPPSPLWIKLSTVSEDADWFEENSTNVPNDINDHIYTNGNVGIRDNDPNATLNVVGPVRASDAANESEYIEMDHGGSNAFINWTGDGNLNFREGNGNLMTLESTSGNLGLGTTNPNQLLHLNDLSGGLETIRVEDLEPGGEGDYSQNSGGNMQTNTTNNRAVYVDGSGDMTARYVYGDNIQSVVGTTNTSTSSTSWSNVAQLTITFTPRHSVVFVTFSISGSAQLGNTNRSYWLLARLQKDGVVQKGTGTVTTDRHSGGVNSAYNVSMNNYPVNVTPGVPTTIRVQWRIGGTNIGTARSNVVGLPDHSHRNLFILD